MCIEEREEKDRALPTNSMHAPLQPLSLPTKNESSIVVALLYSPAQPRQGLSFELWQHSGVVAVVARNSPSEYPPLLENTPSPTHIHEMQLLTLYK